MRVWARPLTGFVLRFPFAVIDLEMRGGHQFRVFGGTGNPFGERRICSPVVDERCAGRVVDANTGHARDDDEVIPAFDDLGRATTEGAERTGQKRHTGPFLEMVLRWLW